MAFLKSPGIKTKMPKAASESPMMWIEISTGGKPSAPTIGSVKVLSG